MTASPDTAAVLTVPALLSIKHVAGVLDCSPRTVRRRITEGSLPAVVDHGRLMIRGDDLHTYVEELERYGPARPRRRPRRGPGRHDFEFLTD